MVEPCPPQHPSGKGSATAAWMLGQRSPEFKASQIMTHWIFHSTSGCNLREKSELEIAFLKVLVTGSLSKFKGHLSSFYPSVIDMGGPFFR